LTKLGLALGKITEELAPLLPRNLTNVSNLVADNASVFPLLPSSLQTHITTKELHEDCKNSAIQFVVLNSFSTLEFLPSKLSTLVTSFPITSGHLRLLPPTLTIIRSTKLLASEDYDLLPRGLVTLSINVAINPRLQLYPNVTSTLALLPPSTSYVRLIALSIENENWFSGAPKSLKYLDLGLIKVKSESLLAPLRDSNIKSLTLLFNNAELLPQLGAILKHLPKRLELLDLKFQGSSQKVELTDSERALLPRSITKLSIPAPRIDLYHARR
jgi:hypothetical protein